ncbi:hypothetical protein F5Y17DRAFT_458870 [Xylariaceae sp. FL0594]|nr:hypothetical protein F5Y17DRAFT_458870 [Xylariaceae sp. FL0594]
MDFTATQPQPHHHPHFHHVHSPETNGVSSSPSTSQCPALRAPSRQQFFQLPVPHPAQSSWQYGRPHSNAAADANLRLLRPPPSGTALPSSLFSDCLSLERPRDQMPPSQSVHQVLQCPAPSGDVVEGPEPVLPHPDLFHSPSRSRPAMHSLPRFTSQSLRPYPRYEANAPAYPLFGQNTMASRPQWEGPAPTLQGPMTPSHWPMETGETRRGVLDENSRPGRISNAWTDDMYRAVLNPSSSPAGSSSEATDPNLPAGVTGNPGSPPSVSRSPSVPTSAISAPERTNEQATHIPNPASIRRFDLPNTSRPRQATRGAAATAYPAASDYEVLLRQREISLVEFSEAHPGVMPNWELARTTQIARKRVASKRALESLQSVEIATLPESERTCVICYNDFGVASSEGINEAPLRLPNCKHVFGDYCIKKWFEESDTCPYCRDKVHSELQSTVSIRRSFPAAMRSMARFHTFGQHGRLGQIRNQNQGRGQLQSGDQGPGQPAQDQEDIEFHWMRPEPYLPDQAEDDHRSTSSDADAENENRSAPGVRGMDYGYLSIADDLSLLPLGRRSQVRRPRPRSRYGHEVFLGATIIGGPTTNGTSQTSVRPSRNSRSRSRSPFDRTATSRGLRSRRSLTDSAEQLRWNGGPLSETSHGVTATPINGVWGDLPGLPLSPPPAMHAEVVAERLNMPETGGFAGWKSGTSASNMIDVVV